jgi:hypothetical protein
MATTISTVKRGRAETTDLRNRGFSRKKGLQKICTKDDCQGVKYLPKQSCSKRSTEVFRVLARSANNCQTRLTQTVRSAKIHVHIHPLSMATTASEMSQSLWLPTRRTFRPGGHQAFFFHLLTHHIYATSPYLLCDPNSTALVSLVIHKTNNGTRMSRMDRSSPSNHGRTDPQHVSGMSMTLATAAYGQIVPHTALARKSGQRHVSNDCFR